MLRVVNNTYKGWTQKTLFNFVSASDLVEYLVVWKIRALDHFQRTLGAPFDLLLSCDDALCEKPDARYFAYARGRYEGAWGFKQGDNLHVAQSQYHDIGISKRLGITTCWIERRHGKSSSGGTIASAHTVPDYHFHTLAQLADAVEAGH